MLNSPIEDIKNRLDIVEVIRDYIKLHRAGANYRAVCPFHNEKKPSFFVSPARQIWHCFGSCSEGGDVFKFIMKIEGVEFGDALRILAQKAGVELKKQDPESIKWQTEKQKLYEIVELACCFFETQLEQSLAGQEAKKYLLERGVKEETIKEWRLGYSPDVWQGLFNFLKSRGYNEREIERVGLCLRSKQGKYYDRFRGRIIFPIFDLSSQPVGFGGRVFKQTKRYDGQEEAKYINSPATILYDKSKILYGLNKAAMAIRKNDKCVLVEGYMDAIMVSQAGIENVAATSGTALTPYQLRIIKRYSNNLYTAFDMDLAGNSATKRGIDLAQEQGFNVKIVIMSEKDPADVALAGPDQLKELIEKAKTIHDFYFEINLSRYDKKTLEGKKDISKILLPVIKRIPNKIEQTIWIRDLSKELEVKEEDIAEEMAKLKTEPSDNYYNDKQEVQPVRKSRKELLEERLAMLIIKRPENISLISQNDFQDFSLNQIDLIDYLLKNEGKINNNVPEALIGKLNCICLKADIELGDINLEAEFKNCLKEFKVLVVKSKLNDISKELKQREEQEEQEERGGNFDKIQQLTEQYNQYSKSIFDLETPQSL